VIGVVIVLIDVAIYPSGAIFLMGTILGVLIFINGVKYFIAPAEY